MLILGLLGMYFDATVVFVTSQTLLLKLAVAILWVPRIQTQNRKTNLHRIIACLMYFELSSRDTLNLSHASYRDWK